METKLKKDDETFAFITQAYVTGTYYCFYKIEHDGKYLFAGQGGSSNAKEEQVHKRAVNKLIKKGFEVIDV